MPGGRKKKLDRPIYWDVGIPQSVAVPVGLLLADPVTGRIKHGARSRLITRLLRQWLAEQQKEHANVSTK